ncbi:GFA family protein [uncultured Desulfuromusa sp.]|uniref:GFA family protein n=1 Tax=uncultured Desulfuromusa sp. TaxID=219183 RepID=UPI002AA79B81|nr:GFA family protein [uncultured Desulfuromusa sp.]
MVSAPQDINRNHPHHSSRIFLYEKILDIPKGLKMVSNKNCFGPQYASIDDLTFIPKYRAACFCGSVHYEVSADPVDAKICHCRTCQTLHGAPMQWAAIFHKRHVRFTSGLDLLHFYNSEQDRNERILPCKISCSRCGTPIADEGRRMWLAFPALFDFGPHNEVPDSFKPTCHLFYGMRVADVCDDLPKWSGHKNHSTQL